MCDERAHNPARPYKIRKENGMLFVGIPLFFVSYFTVLSISIFRCITHIHLECAPFDECFKRQIRRFQSFSVQPVILHIDILFAVTVDTYVERTAVVILVAQANRDLIE